MTELERFLKYVKVNTKSSDTSGLHPSTEHQFNLANLLKDELIEIGCADVTLTDKCYVYARVPATPGFEDSVKIGFIAHMDTSPDFSGEGVDPIITENYDGGRLPLADSGIALDPKLFPHLQSLKGRTLITTNGKTLLGADDKAGIAEIMTLAERLIKDEIPHAEVLIAFTPDEEIGEGADFFDVDFFGADFAYTVDGGEAGVIEYENFNAASATFEISGFNVHPGSAKDVMINASLVAMEINSLLPEGEVPSKTEGYEGFFHLTDICGTVERATLSYIVRDHDAEIFSNRCEKLLEIEKMMNDKYKGCVKLTLKESYRNMREVILPHIHLVDTAMDAARDAGIEPDTAPIRGGTDGARLSFMGLPCPNLGTGGYAFHGPFEHISAEGMRAAVDMLVGIVSKYATLRKADLAR